MLWNIQPNFLKAKASCALPNAKMLPERSAGPMLKPCYNRRLAVTQTRKQSYGFTLLELLAVITLLGLLAVVAVTSLDGVEDDSSIRITKIEMSELRNALRQFKRDVRHFPDEIDANASEENRVKLLVSCVKAEDDGCDPWNTDTARGWNGPYVLSEGIADSWGTPYRLSYEDLQPRLISHGANKQYEGVNTTDTCSPNGDDIVLCLLK
ncbi:MAG: type II secretion system GspH family protein [Methylotenera sp.]|nr:type II secretion system GspH family protein [Methylotenera sp.]